MDNFRYSTKFSSSLESSASGAREHLNYCQASLDKLSPLVPVEVDLEKNVDLLGVAFDAAVVNSFNKNGDGIDSATAVAIKDYFIHKPTNIEHNKSRVVGHILKSAMTSRADHDFLSDEEVLSTIEPMNISLGSVIYKTVDQNFSDMVMSSVDPESELFGVVSASWEIGFNDFYIALGSQNLSEAEIVSDPKVIAELSQYLKANDGNGRMPDGTKVNRLVVGNVFPLGIGFTANPAADVKGVFLGDSKKKDLSKSSFMVTDKIDNCSDSFLKKFCKFKKNISQCNETDVNNSNTKNHVMENQNLFEDIKELLASKLPEKSYSEESVANIAKVVGDAIKEKSEQFEQDKQDAIAAQAEAEAAAETREKEMEELKSELNETSEKLEALEATQKKQEGEARFSLRMEEVDSIYELNDEDRQILASEVSSLEESQESFDSYKEKLSVIWAHKNKEAIAAADKAFEEKIEAEVAKRIEAMEVSKASEETSEETAEEAEVTEETEKTAEEVLDSVEAEAVEPITNNNNETASKEESLKDQFKKTFCKENVTINY